MGLLTKKPLIRVRLKVAGFIDAKMMTAEFELEVPEGASLKQLFALADKSGNLPSRALKRIMNLPRPPTILVNGQSLELPRDLKRKVSAGDEVAVMTPLGGG